VFQSDKKAIGHERNENMSIDAVIGLIIDRFHCKILLQVLEGMFNFSELDVILPYYFGSSEPKMHG